MPLYEYECSQCHKRLEKIQSFSAPPEKVCPNCGGELERVISAPAIQFKGAGWYVNDYARPGGKTKAAEDGGSKADGKTGSGSENGGGAKTSSEAGSAGGSGAGAAAGDASLSGGTESAGGSSAGTVKTGSSNA